MQKRKKTHLRAQWIQLRRLEHGSNTPLKNPNLKSILRPSFLSQRVKDPGTKASLRMRPWSGFSKWDLIFSQRRRVFPGLSSFCSNLLVSLTICYGLEASCASSHMCYRLTRLISQVCILELSSWLSFSSLELWLSFNHLRLLLLWPASRISSLPKLSYGETVLRGKWPLKIWSPATL